MNDADKKKVFSAVAIVTNIEGQLKNIIGRGPNAAKEWGEDYKRSTDDEVKKKLKGDLIPGMNSLVKDAKKVLKDLESLAKETETKKIAAYATGKDFRTKATKLLSSCKDYDVAASKLLLVLMNSLGNGLYPGMSSVDVQATVGYLKNFSTYYNSIRIELAKL